jgi:hypothetical protein
VPTAVGYFLFVADDRPTHSARTLGVHLAFVVISALVLCVAATALPRTPRVIPRSATGGRRWQPFAAGAGLYVAVFVLPELLAEAKVPWPVFVAVLAVLALAAGWAVSRPRKATRGQAVVLVLGCGSAQAGLSVVFGVLNGNIVWAISGAAICAVFVVSVVRLSRKEPAHVGGTSA